MGKFVTRRMDGNHGALPPNSAGWARTSSSGLPPRHYTGLPLAGQNQTIGGETNDTPESCLAERGGKRKATTINYKFNLKKMKHLNKLWVTLCATAVVFIFLVGCKKGQETLNNDTLNDTQFLLSRIEAFQLLRDAVNSGIKTSGTMTVEEMRENLDLVSNFEHSEHMFHFENTVLDTLYVSMPAINANGFVNEADVVATYNAFEIALGKCLANVDDNMNVPSYFSVVMPESGSKDDSEIKFIFDRGIPTQDSLVVYHGPFTEEDNWIWGDGRGKCNGGCFGSDAAQQLSLKFRFEGTHSNPRAKYILSNVEHVVYISHSNNYAADYYVYFEDPNPQTCSNYWIFAYEAYAGDDRKPCIGYDEMNCYWRNLNRLLRSSTGPLHYSPRLNSPYNQCELISRDLYPKTDQPFESVLVHLAKVRYCNVNWFIPIPGHDEYDL